MGGCEAPARTEDVPALERAEAVRPADGGDVQADDARGGLRGLVIVNARRLSAAAGRGWRLLRRRSKTSAWRRQERGRRRRLGSGEARGLRRGAVGLIVVADHDDGVGGPRPRGPALLAAAAAFALFVVDDDRVCAASRRGCKRLCAPLLHWRVWKRAASSDGLPGSLAPGASFGTRVSLGRGTFVSRRAPAPLWSHGLVVMLWPVGVRTKELRLERCGSSYIAGRTFRLTSFACGRREQ